MRRSRNSRTRNHSRNKHNRKCLRSASLSTVYTSGEVFPDGSTIELVQDGDGSHLRLHFFDGEKARIDDQVELDGRAFRPVESGHRGRFVRFPKNSAAFGSITTLFAEVRELFAHFGFSPGAAFAAAIFCCASWFKDILPTAPCLIITGATPEAALLLDLISCLARRSLPVSEFTRGGISAFPLQLQPTLVITAEALSKTSIALFRATNRRRAYFSVKGDLTDLSCAKVIHCAQIADAARIDPDALPIELLPSVSRLETLDHENRETIAEHFQSRFLDYRCRHILDVQHSTFDVPGLGSKTSMLARVLGAAIDGASELQGELASLLRGHEEKTYESHLTDPLYVVVDALLHHLHENFGERLSVGKITEAVNEILLGRGDATERSPREIGAVLKLLDVHKTRRHDGYAFELNEVLSRNIHRRAHEMGIFASRPPNGKCAAGRDIVPPESAGWEKNAGEQS